MKQQRFANFVPPLDPRAKRPKDYHALAKERNFVWVGIPVQNANIKTAWACSLGHVWRAAYNTIQQGAGCPYCAGKARKSPEDYRKLAKARGVEWVASIIPDRADLKTQWRCPSCDYEWQSSYETIYTGSGCPKCRQKELADALRLTREDYHKLASAKGLLWIGEWVQTANKKTLWKCPKCNDEWMSTHSYIRTGNGCPNCLDFVNGNRVSRQQRAIAAMVNGEINTKLGRKYIDVLVIRNNQKIAIEYDSWYWHGGRQVEDAKRDNILNQGGYLVVHIHSNELLPTPEQLENAILTVLAGAGTFIITLDDWGIGNVFSDYHTK